MQYSNNISFLFEIRLYNCGTRKPSAKISYFSRSSSMWHQCRIKQILGQSSHLKLLAHKKFLELHNPQSMFVLSHNKAFLQR